MSGGKGGSRSQSTEIPAYIEDAAKSNLALADKISNIGYTPYYGPDVAAFSPMQERSISKYAGRCICLWYGYWGRAIYA